MADFTGMEWSLYRVRVRFADSSGVWTRFILERDAHEAVCHFRKLLEAELLDRNIEKMEIERVADGEDVALDEGYIGIVAKRWIESRAHELSGENSK